MSRSRLAYYKKWYAKNRAHVLDQQREYRARNRERIRSYDRARYRRDRRKIRKRQQHYYGKNRKDVLAKGLRWYTQHKDRYREYARKQRARGTAFLQSPKGKEWRRAYRRRNQERHNAQTRARYRKDPIRDLSRQHSRRARLRAAGHFTAAEWKSLCAKFNHRCALCHRRRKLTADHVVPLSKGGTNQIENIQPLCKSCNCKKGNR